jgi:hypothetical protein
MTVPTNVTRVVRVVPVVPIAHSSYVVHAAYVRQNNINHVILFLQIFILLNYFFIFYRYRRTRQNIAVELDYGRYCHLLTKREFQQLPHRKVKADNDGEECSICLCQYIRNQRLRVLPCSHYFHTRCIERWLTKMSTSCPLCRYDLDE